VMHGLWLALIWVGVVAMFVITTVNAVYMIASPQRWWKLPPWFRASGSLRKSQYSTGFGAFQVRVLGLFLLGFWVVVLTDLAFDWWH